MKRRRWSAACTTLAAILLSSGIACGQNGPKSQPHPGGGGKVVQVAQGTGGQGGAKASSAKASSSDWPEFRGPTGMGTSPDKAPTKWGPQENIVWKKDIPAGASTPIIVSGKIFLTAYTGPVNSLKLHLLCLNESDGSLLWSKDVPAKLPEQPNPREGHGWASNTPVSDGANVYAFFGKSGVHAFTHAGEKLWEADVGSGVHGWGTAASPIVHGDLVIVNACVESKSLIALDKKTGKERWRAGGIIESWNTPILVQVDGKTELVMAILGKVFGFDPATGDKLWSCNTDIGWYMVPSLVAHDGIVYCIGGRGGGGALAVRAGGKGDVTNTHRLWTGKDGSNVPSLLYHEGHLYWVNDANEKAFCADAKTGNLVYEEVVPRIGGVYPSPVLAGGNIYYISRQGGRTFVIPAAPKFQVLATNELGESRAMFNASPAVANGRLYIRSEKYLYCIGTK